MILTNRRLRLLYLALAGMDIAVLLPWLATLTIVWARNGNLSAVRLQTLLTANPLLLFILFWGVMLGYMLIADLLNRAKIEGAARALLILGLLIMTSLLAVRLLLYPELAPGDFIWLREVGIAVANLIAGVRGELLLIITNYLLWWRVAGYTDRSLTFMSVGLSFRLGMLLVILGSALLSYQSGQSDAGILYMILFFAFGLAATALARIDQKAIGASNSTGALLPWDRFAQLWMLIIGILATAFAAATLYTPPLLRAVLGWFAPLGLLLQWLLAEIAFLVFWLLTPLLEWLSARIQALAAESPPVELAENVPPPNPLTLTEAVQQIALLRYCIGAGIIFVAITLFLIFFARTMQRDRATDPEETGSAEAALRPGALNLGLGRLRDWFALLRRYGVGSQLLAAISVENIYANLSRLARRKGYPRHPAQGPDSYLPFLNQAFPGHASELNAITTAYLRVRYAERPITPQELAALKRAYAAITAPPQDGEERATP
ncbi:MAG: DUF4129 domain-containing protein [Caldilineaceae bacterium]|nr:DUF4129 domain-containing protein [Caldilineaceae bacterium]